MARFRIVQRPSRIYRGQAIFEIEERCLFWWDFKNICISLEDAEQWIEKYKTTCPVETKVIKECD